MKIYSCLIILFCFTNSFAGILPSIQDTSLELEVDTIIANKYFETAEVLSQNGKYDSAIVYYRRASVIYEKTIFFRKFIKCYNKLSEQYWYKNNFDESMKFIQRSLEVGEKNLDQNDPLIAESYELMGWTYLEMGDYEKTIDAANKSLAIRIASLGKNHLDVGKSYNLIGVTYAIQLKYEKAIEYFNKNITVLKQGLGDQRHAFSAVYNNIANIYEENKDFEQAIIYHKKSLSIKLSMLDETHPNLGFSYNNIGNTYKNIHDFKKALYYLEKAVEVWSRSLGETNPNVADCYLNIADVYIELEDYDNAIIFSKKALYIYSLNFDEVHYKVASTYENMGISSTLKKDFANAQYYLEKAFTIFIEIYGEQNLATIDVYENLGNLFQTRGNYEKALYYFQKYIESNLKLQNNSTSFNEKDGYTLVKFGLLRTMLAKAETLSDYYTVVTKNISHLKEAYHAINSASNLIDIIRISYKKEGSKLIFSEQASKIYKRAIKIASELYNITNNESYLLAALQFAEKNKVGVLLESLTESRAKKFSGIPDSLLENEKKLRTDLTFYTVELNKEKNRKENQDSSKIRRYENIFFTINIEYQKLLTTFEKDYPKYYNFKYKFDVFNVDSVQQNLGDNTVLVEYFLSDSYLFIFTIDKNSYDIYTGTPPKDSTIRALNNSIYNLDTDKFLETSYSLYAKLIKPIEEKIKGKQVLLIPDGILHYVPFDALLTKRITKKDKIDYSSLPYLINDYTISYAYSATMAFNEITNSKTQAENNEGYIGFAPVFADSTVKVDLVRREITIVDTFNQDIYRSMQRSLLNRDGTFNSLPASEEEVTNIYKMFKEQGKQAEIYINSNATEEALKSEKLNKFKYVHLATHAFVNEKNPKLSGIVLATDSTKKEDGILYAEEIYNLNLNADLVVLSACESGLGEIVRGEGIIGFTRGLMFSGAKNIIVSLWNVLDKSTALFMTDLYSRILEGKKYAVALRETKLKFISDGLYTEPFYWAAFNLIGN